MVRERAMKRPLTAAGITLAAPPPRVITPCTWSPGGNCWRRRPRATWEIVIASRALTPSHGAAVAWASLPPKKTSKRATARQAPVRRATGEGAPVEHEDLAAAPLFGRRAENPHLQADLVGHRGQGQSGPHRGRRDDV